MHKVLFIVWAKQNFFEELARACYFLILLLQKLRVVHGRLPERFDIIDTGIDEGDMRIVLEC